MADVSTQQGNDNIATDDLVTLNGAAVPLAQKAQRNKPGFGVDGVFRDVSLQFPFPVDTDSRRTISYRGRICSFRTPARAGTTGQKLFAAFNAAASPVLVDIEKLSLDTYATAAKAVAPPILRLYRITAAPTNGTALTNKVGRDTAQTSSSSLTFFGDASADGTSSTTALTHATAIGTITGLYNQIITPRLITVAGYEMVDMMELLDPADMEKITLRSSEGLLVTLDYNVATSSPITEMYTINCKWTEYTAAA